MTTTTLTMTMIVSVCSKKGCIFLFFSSYDLFVFSDGTMTCEKMVTSGYGDELCLGCLLDLLM